MNENNICNLCYKKIINIDSFSFETKKLKNTFEKEMNINEIIFPCKCKDFMCHKICLIIKILTEFKLHCEECKIKYNIKLTRIKNKKYSMYNKIRFSLYFLIILFFYFLGFFLIFYKKITKNLYRNCAILIGIIIILINSYFFWILMKVYLNMRKTQTFDYTININDYDKAKFFYDDWKFYEPFYLFFCWFFEVRNKYELMELRAKHLYIKKINNSYIENFKLIPSINEQSFEEINKNGNNENFNFLNNDNKLISNNNSITIVKIEGNKIHVSSNKNSKIEINTNNNNNKNLCTNNNNDNIKYVDLVSNGNLSKSVSLILEENAKILDVNNNNNINEQQEQNVLFNSFMQNSFKSNKLNSNGNTARFLHSNVNNHDKNSISIYKCNDSIANDLLTIKNIHDSIKNN